MERVESNHMPLSLTLRNEEKSRRTEEEGKIRKGVKKWKICWDEEAKKIYKENTEKVS